MASTTQTKREEVEVYYGKTLETNKDLKTNACCTEESLPNHHKEILAKIHPEILEKYYGCGTPIPDSLNGLTILDLGCGTGRDVYLLSKLVGPNGHVIGLDMTDEQLDIAKKHQASQADTFEFSQSNVTFKKGFIEDLSTAGIADNSIDLVVSNCVINLSPDKPAVFKEILRVLKPGGELYISDVFADRRIPQHLIDDPVLHGECISGAMYMEDFRRLMNQIGVLDFRVANHRRLTIENPEIEQKLGPIQVHSITIRAFKLDLEDKCENYGQSLVYLGTIPNNPAEFVLDDHHTFPEGTPIPVCGNTADMIESTRFKGHFKVYGNKSTHFGLFKDCEPPKEEISGSCC